MKKLAILMCAFCILASASNAAEETAKSNQPEKQIPKKEEMMKMRKAREAAFEQKLGLTDAQKVKAKELRQKGFEKMKPVMDQIKEKKQEAKMVNMSRISVQAQEEKLAVIEKEIQKLEKKAHAIRKQNMKDFESILTFEQKKILKEMKKEGRAKFEQQHRPCPIQEQIKK